MAFVSPKRFSAWLLSLLTALSGAALLASAFLSAERPLQYLHSAAATAAYLLFAIHAVLQLPAALLDRGATPAFALRGDGDRRAAWIHLFPLLGILPFEIECFRLATEVVGGARICALFTAILFFVGSIGLLLRTPLLQLPLPMGCAAFAFYLYFERVTPRNASLKLLVSLAFLLLALLFLLRLRHALGIARPRLTLWLIRAAAPYLFSLGVALAFLSGARAVTYPLATASLFLVLLSFCFYIAYLPRTLGLVRKTDSAEGSPADATSEGGEQDGLQDQQGTGDL